MRLMCTAMTILATAALAAEEYDVVVYGGTAGGVITAIAAANEGASVVLLEPGRHVGGMVTGGLGATDFGRKAVIGGMSREFFERVGKHYSEPISWRFEPHVAERVFNDWLKDAKVKVLFGRRLASIMRTEPRAQLTTPAPSEPGAQATGSPGTGTAAQATGSLGTGGIAPRLTSVKMDNGEEYLGKVFVDCSYEGDLMTRAGVSYTIGREGMDQYGESLAGRRETCEYHQFKVKVSPRDAEGKLLPCVYGGEAGQVGQADRKVQAYNFRICMCNRKDNQVPFPRPADYDPQRYELLKRYLRAAPDLTLDKVIHIVMMPNGKTDVNNNGAFSTDHIGGSWDYPDADYARRRAIWDDHVSYVQGFLYFLANDPSVPRQIQDELNKWGLARDEFVDNDHWPYQLYIREARRMVGEYVMRQADLQTDRTKPDSIGMGSYNSDSHHVQRIPTPEGGVVNEGDMQVPVKPYEIAYRAIVPKRGQCRNLLVPVCFSASHVAYSSMRMEPQYMIMGQAAGLAAANAARRNLPVADVDVFWLQERLREQGAVLSLAEAISEGSAAGNWPGFVIDASAAQVTGDWTTSESVKPFVGDGYLHDENAGKGERSVRFVPDLPADGEYDVRLAYTPNRNRASNVPVVVRHADGEKRVQLNQTQAPADPPFASLGRFRFKAGKAGYVEVRNDGTNGYVVADAVQWIVVK
ncbi:MAG: FAD-dependent oxidoreductase [Planctomycetes bacterium]|nr:FAD-dependent oxidoreductase [Planctomycetota bacterium]